MRHDHPIIRAPIRWIHQMIPGRKRAMRVARWAATYSEGASARRCCARNDIAGGAICAYKRVACVRAKDIKADMEDIL